MMSQPPKPLPSTSSAESTPIAQDLTGSALGGYTILRRLGQGGMADVYLATQDSLGRRVAVKVLKPALAQDANYVRRFHNEARSVAALVHPHIVQVYEVGQYQGWHFIAQEYVAGHSLKQQLKREGSLAVEVAIEILAAAAGALDKASAAGIIHRDIKPDNILLGSDGSVKVADFGLARKSDATATELTQTGMTMGTPLYMSPEQVEGRSLDGRSDIYSLGVTAYHMLVGRPPFEGDTPLAVAMKHVNQVPPSVAEVRPQVPIELSRLIDRMLAKSPDERPRSGAEVLGGIQALSGSLVASGPRTQLTGKHSSAATRALDQALAHVPRATRPWWRSLSLLGAVATGVVLSALLLGGDPLRPSAQERAQLIPQKENARQQYFYAMLNPTEEAFLAVLDYFPLSAAEPDAMSRLYHLRAKQQLARWYIANKQPQPAKRIIDELAALDATDREFQLFGKAWLALAAYHRGDASEASSLLTDIWDERGQLDDDTRTKIERLQQQLLHDRGPSSWRVRPAGVAHSQG